MDIEERKKQEKEFHDMVRDPNLKLDKSKYKYYKSSKKFYYITRESKSFIKEWLRQRCRNKRTLDYCCGEGDLAIFLAKNGAESVGIDISDVSIKIANEKAVREGVDGNTSFFVMDAEALEFDKDYFDIIICSGVLHHLVIENAYSELARVLKPGGEIICNEALKYNPLIQLYRKMTPHLRTEFEAKHILGKKEIEVENKYFGRVEKHFFHLTTIAAVPFRNFPGFNIILSTLEALDSVLLKIPILKWQAWQVVFVLSEPIKNPN